MIKQEAEKKAQELIQRFNADRTLVLSELIRDELLAAANPLGSCTQYEQEATEMVDILAMTPGDHQRMRILQGALVRAYRAGREVAAAVADANAAHADEKAAALSKKGATDFSATRKHEAVALRNTAREIRADEEFADHPCVGPSKGPRGEGWCSMHQKPWIVDGCKK